MRIAIIDPSEFTPPYDAALARGLMASGHAVTVIGEAGGALAAVESVDHRGHFYGPLASGLGRQLSKGAIRPAKGLLHGLDLARLPALLGRLGADVIHLQWAPLPLLDQLALPALRRIAPVVMTVHDTTPYNGAEPWLMAAGLGRLIRGVDAVICHTEAGRLRLLRQGVPTERLFVVPHGLLGAISDTVPPPAARIRLLQLGKLKPYKGVDVLIEALGRLTPGERDRFWVRVVGQPHLDTAPLEARAAGLGDCFSLELDFVDEAVMAALIAESDAMLFPYREIEASGVLMQAIAAGRPVVASRIGAMAELLEDGRQGLLVPPGDPDALAAALRRLAADPTCLTSMRSEMRSLRDRIPDWATIGHQTMAVYAAAVRRRAARSAGHPAAMPATREACQPAAIKETHP